MAVPVWVRDAEPLNEPGQFAEEEHPPVAGPGLIAGPGRGSQRHGGEAVWVGDAGLAGGQRGQGLLGLLRPGLPAGLAFRTKGQLAIDILAGVFADGVRLDFVCGDETMVPAPSCASTCRITTRPKCCGSPPASG